MRVKENKVHLSNPFGATRLEPSKNTKEKWKKEGKGENESEEKCKVKK